MVVMNISEKAAWIRAARIAGERQRREQQRVTESHALGLEMVVKQLIREDKQRQRVEESARRLAEWAQSLPKTQPPAKQKQLSVLDFMSTGA